MCVATGKPPTLECTLGDCKPGTEFHDPNGETWMVLNLPRTIGDALGVDSVMVVNTGNRRGGNHNPFGLNEDEFKGMVTPMYSDLKLGRDHKGMLYASTALNDLYDRVLPLPEDADAPVAFPPAGM